MTHEEKKEAPPVPGVKLGLLKFGGTAKVTPPPSDKEEEED